MKLDRYGFSAARPVDGDLLPSLLREQRLVAARAGALLPQDHALGSRRTTNIFPPWSSRRTIGASLIIASVAS